MSIKFKSIFELVCKLRKTLFSEAKFIKKQVL